MLRIDLVLGEALDHQASLRPALHLAASPRPHPIRRHLGAWLVRLGRAVAGEATPRARFA